MLVYWSNITWEIFMMVFFCFYIIDKFYCESYNLNCEGMNYVCNLLMVLEAHDLLWDLVFHQILVVPNKNIIEKNIIKKSLLAFTLFCFDHVNLTLLSNIFNFLKIRIAWKVFFIFKHVYKCSNILFFFF